MALGFGGQPLGLIAAGLLGILPVPGWSIVALPLFPAGPASSTGGDSPVAMGLGIAAALVLLSLPSVVAVLTLRARQPRGASITWDEEAIVERDGPWRRGVIPWRRARAAHFAWEQPLRNGSVTRNAVQIVDAESGASITAWDDTPKGAPIVRRRRTGDVKPLLDALEAHDVVAHGAIDWTRILDPDRPRRRWVLVLGRLGYPLAIAGAIGAPDATAPGYVLGAIAAVCLAVRAWPVLHELRATRARIASLRAARAAAAAPYRAADPGPAVAGEDDAEAAALRLKLRAVAFEALVRVSFVALTVGSTVVGGRVLHGSPGTPRW